MAAPRRLNIIFVGNSAPGPACAPHQAMPAIWLSARGHALTFVGPSMNGTGDMATPLGPLKTDIVRGGASGRSPLWHARLCRRLAGHRLRAGRHTVFYVHGSVVCPAVCAALAGMPRKRLIYHTQDFLEPGRHPHWEFFEQRVARRAGWVVCNEPNRARLLKDHYGLRQTPTVVRTALPRGWPMPERDEELRRSLLGTAGTDADSGRLVMAGGHYSPVRCSRQLMAACARLPEQYVLVFTGMTDGANAGECRRQMREADIERRVLLLPRLRYEDLLTHFAAADIGVLLYANDGVGNYWQAPGRLTEYMGCGLPFVTSAFPGLERLCVEHRLGIACDPESPDAIAAALRQLGDKPEKERGRERRRLRELFRTDFAYERQADRLEGVLDAVARENGWV